MVGVKLQAVAVMDITRHLQSQEQLTGPQADTPTQMQMHNSNKRQEELQYIDDKQPNWGYKLSERIKTQTYMPYGGVMWVALPVACRKEKRAAQIQRMNNRA